MASVEKDETDALKGVGLEIVDLLIEQRQVYAAPIELRFHDGSTATWALDLQVDEAALVPSAC